MHYASLGVGCVRRAGDDYGILVKWDMTLEPLPARSLRQPDTPLALLVSGDQVDLMLPESISAVGSPCRFDCNGPIDSERLLLLSRDKVTSDGEFALHIVSREVTLFTHRQTQVKDIPTYTRPYLIRWQIDADEGISLRWRKWERGQYRECEPMYEHLSIMESSSIIQLMISRGSETIPFVHNFERILPGNYCYLHGNNKVYINDAPIEYPPHWDRALVPRLLVLGEGDLWCIATAEKLTSFGRSGMIQYQFLLIRLTEAQNSGNRAFEIFIPKVIDGEGERPSSLLARIIMAYHLKGRMAFKGVGTERTAKMQRVHNVLDIVRTVLDEEVAGQMGDDED